MGRTAGIMAVAALLAAGWPGAAPAKDKAPELEVAEKFDAAINGGRAPAAAALFADDAEARVPEAGTLNGRAQIDSWLQSLAGQSPRMDSGNRQVSEGGRVTWTTSFSWDAARRLSVAPVQAFVDATVIAGKIRSLTIRLSSAAQLRLAAAKAKAAETAARSFVDGVLGKGDIPRADALLAPGFVDHDPMPGNAGDAAGYKAGVAAMRKSFPDLAVTIEEVIVSGDLACVRGMCAGTQQGEFLGVPASGRAFRAGFVEILRVVDGRILERWGQRDAFRMLDQLGLTASPATAAPASAGASGQKPAAATPAAPGATPAPAGAEKPKEKSGGWF